MQRLLAFDAMPPLSAPLRYFLAAPLFAMAAGLLLLWQGEAALVSRWAPATLALTHLLTLGFLAMVMAGALLQMLPVVGGIEVRWQRFTTFACHAGLCTGTLALAAGFLWPQPLLFRAAVLLLGAGLILLLAAVVQGLWAEPPEPAAATVNGMRLAFAGLAITVTLGLALAAGFGWGLELPFMLLANLHAGWGLLGWVAMLLVGVAFQVIPMFQATPVYPAFFARRLPAALAILLALWSAAMLAGRGENLAGLGLGVVVLLFAGCTYWLLRRRRRPQPDPTTLNWRLAMASLAACGIIANLPPAWLGEAWPLVLGVLFIAGVAMPCVNGMLFKIVPFLLWYHLQENMGICGRPPGIKLLITDRAANRQFALHAAALALLLVACFVPVMARAAGAAFVLANAAMGWNLLQAVLRYRRVQVFRN